MAIVVEDGSIVTGANSYVSEAELTTYATARGVTLTGNTEELLIRSMDYIEGLDFKGVKFTQDQPLVWPRVNVVVDTYLVSADAIPLLLQEGQIETAMAIDNGEDQLADIPRTKIKSTVGPISVTYSEGSTTNLVRKVSNKLAKLLASGGTGGTSFIVNRG